MARWFADDRSHPLVILKNERRVGFALVSRPPRHERVPVDYRMAEFFVTARSRRLGVGRDAAKLIFNRFGGRWEICEFQHNEPSVAFWRSVVAEYTGGRFSETLVQGEVRQMFSTKVR